MKLLKMAFRNLARQKKRTALICGAIGFSVMIITIINCLIAGILVNMEETIPKISGGHIFISQETKKENGMGVYDLVDVEKITNVLLELGIEKERIKYRSKANEVTFNFRGEKVPSSAVGIDWDHEKELISQLVLKEGTLEEITKDPSAILLPRIVAENLKVKIGDVVELRSKTITGQDNLVDFTVRGILQERGYLDQGISPYTHKAKLNELINRGQEGSGEISILLHSIHEIKPIYNAVSEKLSQNFTLASKTQKTQNNKVLSRVIYKDQEKEIWSGSRIHIRFFDSAELAKAAFVGHSVGGLFLLLLMLISTIGIINTFVIMVHERVAEIGTMRALGLQKKQVTKLFLYEALCIAFLGYFLGLVFTFMGRGLIYLVNIPFQKAISSNFFSLFTNNGIFSFSIQPLWLMINLIGGVIFTIFAAYGPARSAAKLQPAEALRAS